MGMVLRCALHVWARTRRQGRKKPRDHAGSEKQEDLPGQGMSDDGNRGKDADGCHGYSGNLGEHIYLPTDF